MSNISLDSSSLGKSKSVVFRPKSELTNITNELVEDLIEEANKFPTYNARLCLHESVESTFHQMLVLERFDKYYPPHSHSTNTELHFVFFGKLAVVLTDDSGSVISSVLNHSDVNHITRVPPKVNHLLVPLTDFVVYMELTDGPKAAFSSEVYTPHFEALFSCSSNDPLNQKQELYMNYIRNSIGVSS